MYVMQRACVWVTQGLRMYTTAHLQQLSPENDAVCSRAGSPMGKGEHKQVASCDHCFRADLISLTLVLGPFLSFDGAAESYFAA